MKFNKLIPELSVSDVKKSLQFFRNVLGFKIEYQREKFIFLSLEGSQLMIDEGGDENSPWFVGKLEYPRGRGMHFQIQVQNIQPILDRLKKNNYPLKDPTKDYWFRRDDELIGMRGFLVQDPDGYLLLIFEDIGTKELNKGD